MDMLIGGEWVSKARRREIRSPYDGAIVDTVPAADAEDVKAAIDAAEQGAQEMAKMPAHQRSALLRRTSELLADYQEEIAQLLAREVGKTINEGRGEASRPPAIFDHCADAARHIAGEVIPFDAAVGGEDRQGFCKRVPCGIVSAISPFNFPVALSAHKVGPALAAGNSVVLKPASQTPLAALKMAEAITEAGFPPGACNVVTASGAEAEPMVTDERVRVVTFTGSAEVGRKLSCISVQKILVHKPIYQQFLDEYVPLAQELKVGDPLDESTDVGPMISEQAAQRAEQWVQEALQAGGKALCGATREGTLFQPTVLVDVPWGEKVTCQEAFAPLVVIYPIEDIDEAIKLTNATPYGLQTGIYTQDIATAFRFADEVDQGGVNINETCWWRADFQPYGGMKNSGIGREGIKYAIDEMTEWKTITFKLG